MAADFITYVSVAQGAAGTTVLAAASTGKRHKVVSVIIVLSAAGTLKFTGSGDKTGAMDLAANAGFVAPSGAHAYFETDAGEALSIVTTGGAARGVVGIITEN